MPASAGPRTSCRSCSGGAIVASSQSSTVSRPRRSRRRLSPPMSVWQSTSGAPSRRIGPRSASRRSSWASTSSARGSDALAQRALARPSRGVEPLERGQALAQVDLEVRLERVARRQQAGQRRGRGVDRGQGAAELGRERRRPLRPGRRRVGRPRTGRAPSAGRVGGRQRPPTGRQRGRNAHAPPVEGDEQRQRRVEPGGGRPPGAGAGPELEEAAPAAPVRDDVAGRRVADRDELERVGREVVGAADRLGQGAAVDRRLVLHRRGAPILGARGPPPSRRLYGKEKGRAGTPSSRPGPAPSGRSAAA